MLNKKRTTVLRKFQTSETMNHDVLIQKKIQKMHHSPDTNNNLITRKHGQYTTSFRLITFVLFLIFVPEVPQCRWVVFGVRHTVLRMLWYCSQEVNPEDAPFSKILQPL